MHRYKRADAAVYELNKQPDAVGMYAATALQKGAQACYQGRLYAAVGQRPASSGGVTPDDVVLQVFQITVVYAPLSHGTEARIDAVNYLLGTEIAQETVTAFHLRHRQMVDIYLFVGIEKPLNLRPFKFKVHTVSSPDGARGLAGGLFPARSRGAPSVVIGFKSTNIITEYQIKRQKMSYRK